jgi:hypothetical protein
VHASVPDAHAQRARQELTRMLSVRIAFDTNKWSQKPPEKNFVLPKLKKIPP